MRQTRDRAGIRRRLDRPDWKIEALGRETVMAATRVSKPPAGNVDKELHMNRAWMLIPAVLLPILCHAAEQSCSRPAAGEPASARIAQIEKMEHERVQAGVRKDVEAIAAVTADGAAHSAAHTL